MFVVHAWIWKHVLSTFWCSLIVLNPILRVAVRSDSSAASVGAVYSPSGHQDWSRLPVRKVRLPFRSGWYAVAGRASTWLSRQLRLLSDGKARLQPDV